MKRNFNEQKNNDDSLSKREPTFSEQVDAVLAGKASVYDTLKVCDTPQVLLDAGLRQLPILYTQNHLKDALHEKSERNTHWHGLTVEQIKKIPEQLKEPAILLDSLSSKNSDGIIAVLSIVDKENAPLFAAIKPNGKGTYNLEEVDSNFMLSVYGKDNGFSEYIERAINENKILYWNKEKSQELFMFQGLQLPEAFNNLDSNRILHQTNSSVNSIAQSAEKSINQSSIEGEKTVAQEIEPEKGKPVEEVTPEQSEKINALRTALNEYFDSGKRPENDRFIVGKTPFVLQMTGSRVTEVTVPVSVIKKASEAHGLSREEIYESLANIYNPILIFDSDKKSTENKVDSKLVLTDIFKDEKPLALAVNVNSFVQQQSGG